MTYQAGDTATLTLDVDPADTTTSATVLVTAPDGTPSSPGTNPNGTRARWTAQLPVPTAGRWRAVWTVTGAGAGVAVDELDVVPVTPPTPIGRLYATEADLTVWLEGVLPPRAGRLLAAASRLVDRHLVGAIYPTDSTGRPTTQRHADALLAATCAQVEHWSTTGTGPGTGGATGYRSVQIGSVRLDGPSSSTSTSSSSAGLCDEALSALAAAGLLPAPPVVVG